MTELLHRLHQRDPKLEYGVSLEEGATWKIQLAEDAACNTPLKSWPGGRVAFVPENRRDVTRWEVFALDVEDAAQFAGEEFFVLREIIWI
jgi:hypothetical protein